MEAARLATNTLRRAIVRIADDDGVTLGTGIFLSLRAILTCAHVVDGLPTSRLTCVFFGREQDPRSVVAVHTTARNGDLGADVAMLLIDEPFHAGETPLMWSAFEVTPGAAVGFAGFRQEASNASNPEIAYTYAGFFDPDRSWYMLQEGCARGFSGGPVFRDEDGRVTALGMVIANLRAQPQRTWFLPRNDIELSLRGLDIIDHLSGLSEREVLSSEADLRYRRRLEALRSRHSVDQMFMDLGGTQLLPYPASKTSIVSTLQAWIRESEQTQIRAFVLGNYGTGKTCIAIETAYRCWQTGHNRALKMPIYLELRDWRALPGWSDLARHLAESGQFPFASERQVMEAAAQDRLFFLLDGLDEVSSTLSLQDSVALVNEIPGMLYEGASFVAFARLSFFLETDHLLELFDEDADLTPAELSLSPVLSKCRTLHLAAPTAQQIERYVETICGSNAEFAIDALANVYDLPDLAKRPVLLRMITQCVPALKADGRQIIRPGDLYDAYTTQWLRHPKHRAHLTVENRRRTLEELAVMMWRSGQLRTAHQQLSALLAECVGVATVGPLMYDIGNCSFLDLVDGGYEFSHKSFLEYFVAAAIERDLLSVTADHSGPLLISSLLKGATSQNEVMDFLRDRMTRRLAAGRADVTPLVKALSSADPETRGRVGHLLGYVASELGDERLRDTLVKAFHQERDIWAKRSLAIACGRAGAASTTVFYVESLLPLPEHREVNLRYHLEYYGTVQRVVSALLSHLMSDRHDFLRSVDVFTIRQIIAGEPPMDSADREFAAAILAPIARAGSEQETVEAVRQIARPYLRRYVSEENL